VFSCSAILDRIWSFGPGEEAVRTGIKGVAAEVESSRGCWIEAVYGVVAVKPLK